MSRSKVLTGTKKAINSGYFEQRNSPPLGCHGEAISARYDEMYLMLDLDYLLGRTFHQPYAGTLSISCLFKNGVRDSSGQISKAIFGIHAALCTIHVGDCLSDMQ
jgi:hypothetical protein